MTADPSRSLETLVRAIRNLASDASFQEVRSMFDENSSLKKQIETQTNDLHHLRAQMAGLETRHETRVQENLELYRTHSDKLELQRSKLSRGISGLAAAVKQRDQTIVDHERSQKELRGQLVWMVRALEEERKKVTDANTAAAKLQQDLKTKNAGIGNLEKVLLHERSQFSKARDIIQILQMENAAIRQRLNLNVARVNQLEGYARQLHEEDESIWISRMDNVWETARHLVELHLSQDIQEKDLEKLNAWKTSRELPCLNFLDQGFPLPQSNSTAAKQMRTAVLLAILARCINEFIFQPTYIVNKDDTMLRQFLARLAVADSEKESFCRAVLLSIYPEEQANSSEERVERVVREVAWYVGDVLPKAQCESLLLGLSQVVHQACDAWKMMQCATEKFEPDFTLTHYQDLQWQALTFEETVAGSGRQGQGLPTISGMDEEILVVFPRVYIIDGADPEPMTPGVVLRRSQSVAAAAEVDGEKPSSPVLGRAALRRSARFQTKSIAANSGNGLLS